MQVIPLKNKYQLDEQDINDLSRLLAEGVSLAHMSYFFKGKLTAEQIYIAAGILSREMYDTPLAEFCPHLVEERRSMNEEKGHAWQQQKQDVSILSMLKGILEDLSLYEFELITRAKK